MKREEFAMTEVVIKLLTNNDMYYTYAVLNKDTDIVEACKQIDEDMPLSERLERATEAVINELEYKLNNNNVILAFPDRKIISTTEIKEVMTFNR